MLVFSMDKHGKHYTKWKKPDTKATSQVIPFLWNVCKRQTKRDYGVGLRGDGNGQVVTTNRHGVSSQCSEINGGDDYTTLDMLKITKLYALKANVMECKL